jgi:TolB-like protein/Flp pilus assembly protein TadD
VDHDIPDRLGDALAARYRIERVIGRGGSATVYRALDRKHGRAVAIKVLRPELAFAVGADRFLREIEVCARLVHPHILPLHDSGEAAGFLYYVMPFVVGESLRARLEASGPLSLDEAMRIARDVSEALDYAHAHGIVHRDVKPENVLLDAGHALVTDFGLADVLYDAVGPRLSEPGLVAGTPEYMSPEQAAGESVLDARSDLYSLACVIYEMLAGEPPFHGASPRAVMARHGSDPPPPLGTVRPDLPPAVARALARGLAKAPADRFPTGAELLRALESDRPDDAASAPSVAVLPFTSAGEEGSDWLGDGLSEEIINALARLPEVRVAARTSSFAFRGAREDVRAIGRRLGVSAVLEGSVRRAGDRLRVTAQLVSVADGYELWAGRFDRRLADIFALQDEIAGNLAGALAVVLSEHECRGRRPAPTRDVRAYEYYLRGRQLFHEFRRQTIQAAREMFERAIALDGGYALAHAGAADCASMLHMYWGGDAAELERAETASRTALALGPDVAEAHAARGLALALRGGFEAAEREFLTAIRLDPSAYEAHYFYARACFQHGRPARAAELFETAARIRDDYQAWFFAAQARAALREAPAAAAAYRRSLEVTRRHLELHPGDARAVTMGAVALSRLGERDEGLRWAERALAIEPDDAGVSYNVACLFALAGMPNRALDCLRQAIRGGFWHREWARNDPDLDSLRQDGRFRELLAADPDRGSHQALPNLSTG